MIKKAHTNDPFLIKEAYYGEPSRPIFPLDQDFQKEVINSYVATHGKCKFLNDIDSIIENQKIQILFICVLPGCKVNFVSPIFNHHPYRLLEFQQYLNHGKK
ncbi:hypothetical protein M0811_11056 [Anaeramoeba ignava]|uniref:Uncharacterized protein n=1 Tax=Anaeramoeba ignava TaxID=1746090 RepID=A0A9Q0R7N5_ANAIG|nr:hypothetical protein M0811_11056 [Anaeramoeba ignava]